MIKDDIKQYLQNTPALTYWIFNSEDVVDLTNTILYDDMDDKLGRIRDLFNYKIEEVVNYVYNNPGELDSQLIIKELGETA